MDRPNRPDDGWDNPDTPQDDSPVAAETALRKHLETHRLTYRAFIRALVDAGVTVENSAKGSGHILLRHGQHNGAIASKDRKSTEKWQPHSVMKTIKHMGVPAQKFLDVLQGRHDAAQDRETEPDPWPMENPDRA